MNVIVPLLVFVTLGVGAIQLSTKSIEPNERAMLLRYLYIAFALRVAVAVGFELFEDLRFFHEDANGYEGLGMRLADEWRGRVAPFQLPAKNPGFFVVAGVICFVFGPFGLNVAMFNTVVGTVTAVLIYRLARKLFHNSVARLACLLVAFTPSMIMWSGIALKDALATCLIVVALSACVSLKERISLMAVAGIVLPLVAMQWIRFYIVYFVVFAVVVSLAIDRRGQVVTRLYRQVIVLGALVGLFVMLGVASSAMEGTDQFDLKAVNSYRMGMALSAKSGFSQDIDISTPQNALAFLPIGVATLLLAPFPWQMVSFRTIIAAPETIVWWFFFPATLRGIKFVVRRKFGATSPILLFMVALTAVYGLTQGNVGSAFRQRAQIFVFLFIFTAVGWYVKRCQKLGVDPEILLRGDSDA